MGPCPIARCVPVVDGVRSSLEHHARACGDRVAAVALHPDDFDALGLVELWGVPVLAWRDVARGKVRLLCDAEGHLIEQVHTVEDLLERWAYGLEYPPSKDVA